MKTLYILIFLFFTTGCASEYKTNYRYANGVTQKWIDSIRENPIPMTPYVEHISSPNTDADTFYKPYIKRSYLLIGGSFFNSTQSITDNEAIEQGNDIGADLVVIFNPRYIGSTTNQVPFSVPTTTSSFTNSTATAYGSSGIVNAYGTSRTTTYGSQTTFAPITVNHVDYGALYFIKARHPLGALTRELTDSERKFNETNKGAVVKVIMDNSPAFYNDILVEDVITEINGISILDKKSYTAAVYSNINKLIKIKIIRNGKPIEKEIQLTK